MKLTDEQNLKNVSIEMRNLAFKFLDKNYPNLTEQEKDSYVLGLFHHGVVSQLAILKKLYGIDVSNLIEYKLGIEK